MKLAICEVLSGGYRDHVPRLFHQAMRRLQKALYQEQVGLSLVWLESNEFPTSEARNELVDTALRHDVDRVLFLDADHDFQPEAPLRLIRSEKDIITGRYHVKKPPYHPNLYMIPKVAHLEGEFKRVHYGQGVFTVDRCGAGALAISRRALEAVGDPWFAYQRNPKPPHRMTVSEDFWFCQRAQEEGFEIWADWAATFDHLTLASVNEHYSTHYLEQMEQAIAGGEHGLVSHIVARGYPDGYQLPSGQTVTDYACDPV